MQSELTGPDLKSGIAAAELKDKLVGHFDGEPVLLIRRDNEVLAIAASCTHYGGPLGEGLITADSVRCPWHHACFDLRTGEAVRAPALAPVATYDVEVRDRIRVTKKRDGGLKSAAPQKKRVAIVGAGAAGAAAADMLHRRGINATLIGPEDPVDRPNLSKEYLAGNAPEEWLPLPVPENVERIRKRTTRLDAKTKTLTFDGGTSQSFDAILLATGAEPVRLPIPGVDKPHVHLLRTAADSRAIIDAAQNHKRAVIIGAGFIGLEVAASLRARKVEVSVIAPEEIPLARIMGDDVGRFIQRLHESNGVRFFLGRGVKSIEKDAVIAADGEQLPADFVVMGGGVRPNVQLAESAGLKVDNGIVVNEFLETSSPGIFAVGDVARYPDRYTGNSIRVEHWVVAEQQAQHVARVIAGDRRPYQHAPFFWSAHYDVIINYVGNATGWEKYEVRGSLDDRNALVAYRRGNRTVAVATIFRDVESLQIEAAMEAGDAAAVERIVS
ncbi:MAG TPA: FAD-dependent oxidoreductase [Thermoanaerobaculia bacterium]|nr:FAD-dependent oxidoreductase [Thermoanaerobaculia bacterium]